MIYSNENRKTDYSNTVKVFTDLGYPSEIFADFAEWMDISSERNYSITEKTEYYTGNAALFTVVDGRSLLEAYYKDTGIRRPEDEWTDRMFLFCSRFMGCAAVAVLQCLVSRNWSREWARDYLRRIKAVFEAENSADVQEKICVFSTAFMKGNDAWYGKDMVRFSVSSAVTAAKFRDDVAAAILAMVLDDDSASAEERKAACNMIREMTGVLITGRSAEVCLSAAVCLASHERQDLLALYTPQILKNSFEAADFMIRAKLSEEKSLGVLLGIQGAVSESFVLKLSETVYFRDSINKKYAEDSYVSRIICANPSAYLNALTRITDIRLAEQMFEVLKKTVPSAEYDRYFIRDNAREYIKTILSSAFKDSMKVRKYFEGSVSLDELFSSCTLSAPGVFETRKYGHYCRCYGNDEFIMRVIALMSQFTIGAYSFDANCITNYTGFVFSDSLGDYTEYMIKCGISPERVIRSLSNLGESAINFDELCGKMAVKLEKYSDRIAGVSADSENSFFRSICTAVFVRDLKKYSGQVSAMAEYKVKYIRNAVVKAFSEAEGVHDEISALLFSKKAGAREAALEIIEKTGPSEYISELCSQYEKEKSAKLKERIGVLAGKETESRPEADMIQKDIVSELTKGNRARKVAWVFKEPVTSVSGVSGDPVDESVLKALLVCFAEDPGSVNPAVDSVLARTDRADLEKFALDVLGRWINEGADSKNKWVLYFTAVFGGSTVVDTYVKLIRDWSENMRSAIAGEAVKALALNGSPKALMTVDNMSRKYKNKQVRRVAGEALSTAADALGITREELADRIVPDLGFDENMCRIFDYGPRQFSVYITRDLKPEVYNGDKKLKDLPKPGANDDPVLSKKAYEEYREMKKMMKTVVSAQTARLEYVLMCDRKWTKKGFDELFVKNPVMHCFAEGLIWAVYENGVPSVTFRYMEDGSFTTSDEEEFEIPENAQIGLVHPIELSEEELETWKEQLSDYEITQPFDQLSRKIYRKNEDELDRTEIKRFEGKTSECLSLHGKMTKNGWDKGYAQDAGFFYEYRRSDITGCVTGPDGKKIYQGYGAEMEFSGMYIQVSWEDNEDVTLKDLTFYNAENGKKLRINEVSPRYFSEIIRQMCEVTGTQL